MDRFTILVDSTLSLTVPYDFLNIVQYKRDDFILHNGVKLPFEWNTLNSFPSPRFIYSKEKPPHIVFEKCERWIFGEFHKTIISYMWSNYREFLKVSLAYFVDGIQNEKWEQYFKYIIDSFDTTEEIISEMQLIHTLTTFVVEVEPKREIKPEVQDLLNWLDENLEKTDPMDTTPILENVPATGETATTELSINENSMAWKTYSGPTCYERVEDICKRMGKLCQFKFKYDRNTKHYLYKVLVDGIGTDISKTKSSTNKLEAEDFAARHALKTLILENKEDFIATTNYNEKLNFLANSLYGCDPVFEFIDLEDGLCSIKGFIGTQEYTDDKIYLEKEYAKEQLSNHILNYIQGYSHSGVKRSQEESVLANKRKQSEFRQLLHTFLDQRTAKYTYEVLEFEKGKVKLYSANITISYGDQDREFQGNFRHASKDQAKEEVAKMAYNVLNKTD